MVLDQGEQRDQKALVGEVDLPNQLPRFVEHVPKRERDRFETGQQTLIFLAGQGRQQLVGGRFAPTQRRSRLRQQEGAAARGIENGVHLARFDRPQRRGSRGPVAE